MKLFKNKKNTDVKDLVNESSEEVINGVETQEIEETVEAEIEEVEETVEAETEEVEETVEAETEEVEESVEAETEEVEETVEAETEEVEETVEAETEEVEETVEAETEEVEETVEAETEEVEETVEAETEAVEETIETETEEESDLEIIEEPTSTLEPEEVPVKNKKNKALKVLKYISITLLSIALFIGSVYAAGVYYFQSHFFYNTSLNGIVVDFKTIEEVHEFVETEVKDYTLTIHGIEDSENIITGDMFDIQYVEGEDVALAMEVQNPYRWPYMFTKVADYTMEVSVAFDEELLIETFNQFDIATPEVISEPYNAYPVVEDGAVKIVEEIRGNQLIEEVDEIIISYVYGLKSEVDLIEEKAYLAPEFISESAEVIAAVELMETYLLTEIKYSEGESIKSSTIAEWILVDHDTMEVSIDTSAIASYVSTLEKKYNTYSDTITFTNPVGKEATVKGGSYGNRVNTSGEAAKIIENIEAGKSVSREIVYSQKGSTLGSSNPFGDTYVCLDLTLQKVYMLYEGAVVLTSDVVTGSVAAGNATPQGVYKLSYKTKNAVLRGTRYADGSYSYESPVSYWMPFNGGIGFHDASWRSEYGGTIYKNNGSHGCVNMPLANAATLYSYITTSMPIVCHY